MDLFLGLLAAGTEGESQLCRLDAVVITYADKNGKNSTGLSENLTYSLLKLQLN